jgi:nicotinamide riboside kinase
MRAPARRIGLIGGECTGKSTLALALAEDLGACVVPEYLRAFVEIHDRPPTRDEQRSVMSEQQGLEDSIAGACASGIVVADPAVLMTAVYSLAYFHDDSLVADAVDSASQHDLLVWCAPDLPWEPDGAQRDGPEYRLLEHRLIADLVAAHLEPEGIPVLLVEGTLEDRRAAVQRAWQPGPPQPPT